MNKKIQIIKRVFRHILKAEVKWIDDQTAIDTLLILINRRFEADPKTTTPEAKNLGASISDWEVIARETHDDEFTV